MSAGRPRDALTRREIEVLNLAATGLTTKQIARELGVAPRVIDEHLYRAKMKLGVRNRTQLIAHAVAAGLITIVGL